MKTVNRRSFIKGSVGAAAMFAVAPRAKSAPSNDRIVMGVMGLGGRGTYLAEAFARRPDVEIAYLCDVNTRRFGRAREAVMEAQDTRPEMTQDFRDVLADDRVHALIVATPDHWHAPASIMACRAGKDVYVEKPMAHNVREGRKMIEAARKYKRVVQVGMQSRSAPYMAAARAYVESGKLGEVHLVRVYNMMKHSRQQDAGEQPVPDGFDYDMWCGPAAMLPYRPSRRWLNQWEYSCGPIAGDAIHQLDLARYLLGDPAAPKAVAQLGAIDTLRDGRDTPDTQMALFEYDGLTLQFEATLWTPYMKKTPAAVRDGDRHPDWPFSSTKIEVLGTDGYMQVGRHGGGWRAYDGNGELVRSEFGRQADREHQDDFVARIRDRQRPAADAEVGHLSALLCHLANISYRAGNQRLDFDAGTESFPHCEEANAYLRRSYRKPWVVPDEV